MRFMDHPHFDRTAEFCELYDSPAFDAHGETLPLPQFEPMLRRVLAKPRAGIHGKAVANEARA
jgi:hypothetical protein